ncbi:unnamed protein product [Closterium sp. NIES-64]|nr:unnamed protein product [Closterium sp. NIES-64]
MPSKAAACRATVVVSSLPHDRRILRVFFPSQTSPACPTFARLSKVPVPSPSVGHEWQAEADVEVTIAEGDTAVGVKAADKAVERAADSAAAQDGKTQQREKMLQGFAEKDSSRSSWRGCADVAGGRGGVGRMARGERQRVVEAALETTEQDNEAVMGKIRARLERCVSRMGQGVVEAALETTEQDNDAVTGKMWARLERCVGEEQGRGVGEGSHDREAQALGLSEQGKEAVMGKIRVQLEIATALTTCGVDTLPLSPSRSFPNQPAFFPRAPTSQSMLRSMRLLPDKRRRFPILHGCSGALKPGRMTLLLGSPGAGKTTLMTALAGHLDRHLKLTGSITYNGQQLKDFNPARTASYVPECDEHIGEMTVRETMDFSAQLQGRGPFRGEMTVRETMDFSAQLQGRGLVLGMPQLEMELSCSGGGWAGGFQKKQDEGFAGMRAIGG